MFHVHSLMFASRHPGREGGLSSQITRNLAINDWLDRKRLEALEQRFSNLEDQLARHIRNEDSVSIDPEIRALSLAKREMKRPVQYDTEANEPARPSLPSSVPFDSRRQEPVRLPRSPDIVMNMDNQVGQQEVNREEVHPDGSWIHFNRTNTYSENMTPNSGTQETWMLVQEYLEDFNCAIPLFDKGWVKSTFIQLYVDCGTTPRNSSLAFHIILAMAYRLRAQSPVSSIEDDLQGREHLKYACSQLGDLLIQEPSLTQVQCLVGIAVVIQGTSASERTAAIISAALRLIQQLCACSLSEAEVGSPEEEHQLEIVFWIAFLMEVSICLRTRQTPTINIYDDHIEQSAKRPCNLGKISTMNNDETFDIFQSHVQLAILQTKVLASMTPPLLTKGGLYSAANSFQTLCQDFRAWRQSFPAAMSSSRMCYTFHRSDIIHIFVLEAKAFETVCALHGISNETLEELKYDQLSGGGRALSFISEGSLVVEEAKRFLNLAALAPRGDVACNR